ncbi:MAG: KamA family radical SAM protein [Methanosarcinales archaeon]|nr:KamA family radical SAM protein [ANME-2 cluster archaeon]MDW7776191.1 KamA family radical SAM protein [Methanosarcinales archaeon]
MKELITATKDELMNVLWESNPQIYHILRGSEDLLVTRNKLSRYLSNVDAALFSVYSNRYFKNMNILEKKNARECIGVLKTIIRTENEKQVRFSALKMLSRMAKEGRVNRNISKGFICEWIFLFRGISGRSGLYTANEVPSFVQLKGKEAALERMKFLDNYAGRMEPFFEKYRTGLETDLVHRRSMLKEHILQHFGADEGDWSDYRWHLKHIISDIKTLQSIIKLDKSEMKGLKLADKYHIPFQATPYYLSLFDSENLKQFDRSIRAQVLPSANYCNNFYESKQKGISMDFMEEESTSPIEGITRRYPKILILKPYKSCPQICVYCQRNWELETIEGSEITRNVITKSIDWVADNPHISEVLVTGGDPLTLDDSYLDWLLGKISDIEHIERIRIGTRTLVTLPFRFTDGLLEVFSNYQCLGERELCLMTHFQHPTEITPDVLDVVSHIKKRGINIYNQQVFTYYNSKKFETCLLRKTMKKSGIDPYYTFNTKGKDETIDYRVPISRIEQERKEEARLLPGLERTDEPVFNVPRLGKSHLRAWQDHEVIMILPNGRRVYRFYPWESNLELVEPYNYVDVSIYDYLERLYYDDEDIDEYSSIWYYF